MECDADAHERPGADPSDVGAGDVGDGGGIGTFVGRVRGRLDDAEAAWVAATSAQIEALRAALADAHLRLVEVETALGAAPGGEWPGPAGADTDAARRLADLVVSLRGEQLVDELLTARVLAAPPGATGGVVSGPRDGWHLELVRDGGGTMARADVLLTADADGLQRHLSARPTVDVVYTSTDTAAALAARGADAGHVSYVVVRPGEPWPSGAGVPVVVDVGTSRDDIAAGSREVREAAGVAPVDAGWSSQPLLDAVPLLGLAAVAGRAAVDASTTDAAADHIGGRAWRDARDVVTGAGVARLVTTLSGVALLRVPVGMTVGLSRAAVRGARTDVDLSVRRLRRARRLLEHLRSGE